MRTIAATTTAILAALMLAGPSAAETPLERGQVVVCTEGTQEELLARNCNTYHPDLGVPPNYFVDVWHPWVSELDLFSALEGKVPEGQ